MNLINSKERRTRVKKPTSLIVISGLLILSPIYYYCLLLFVKKLPVSWFHIQSIRLTGIEICFVVLPVICGIGLYLIKKWAWYLFIVYSSVLIVFNTYASIRNPIGFNFYSLIESTIIFLGAVYFLKKDISAPYLKMYPRGWRGELRKPIQMSIRIDSEEKLTKDISEAGFYVDWNEAPFAIGQEVKVEVDAKSGKRVFAAGVVRKDENGVGFAFRRLGEEDSQWIMATVKEV
jgi:hypothetical protein